jgi:hypothetical protein
MNYIGVDCHISTFDFAVVDGNVTIKKKACVNTGLTPISCTDQSDAIRVL